MLTTGYTRDRSKVEIERRPAMGEPARDVVVIEEVMTKDIAGRDVLSHLRITVLISDDRIEVVLP